MDKLYYIENTVSEINSCVRGYFSSFEDAKECLKDCCDWYREKGTGKIYEVKFGLNEKPKLIYKA